MNAAPEQEPDPLSASTINAGRLKHFCMIQEKALHVGEPAYLGDPVALSPEIRSGPHYLGDVRTSDVLQKFQGDYRITTLGKVVRYITKAIEIYAKHFDSPEADQEAALNRMCSDVVDFVIQDLLKRDPNLDIPTTAAKLTNVVTNEARNAVLEEKREAISAYLGDNIVGIVGENIVKRDPAFAAETDAHEQGLMVNKMTNAIDHSLQELLGNV